MHAWPGPTRPQSPWRGKGGSGQITAELSACAARPPSAGLVKSEFLWRWFLLQYEATRERGGGSGPQALNCQRVRELPFVLPPLPEQQEIVRRVETLFALADKIEARYAKAKAQVDRLTPSLLARAFAGKLVPQDPADEPAAVLLERIRGRSGPAASARPYTLYLSRGGALRSTRKRIRRANLDSRSRWICATVRKVLPVPVAMATSISRWFTARRPSTAWMQRS